MTTRKRRAVRSGREALRSPGRPPAGGASTDARSGQRSRLGVERGRRRWCRGIACRGNQVVPGGWRHATIASCARRRSRRRGDTFPSPSVRRSRFYTSRAMACVRSPAGSGGRLPHSRANCGAARPRAAAASSTGPRPRRAADGRRPKPAKLAINVALHDYVQERLAGRIATPDGKERMGRISKMGDPYLRRLMVVGATSRVRIARSAPEREQRLAELLQRKPARVATVALANRTARIVWALMARGGVYRSPTSATSA